jgi:hypothetical protein
MARKIQTRKANKTILIIVEGYTEQIYFNQLRVFERIPGVTIIPKIAKHSAPFHIIQQSVNALKEDIYDYIWCVFDCDTPGNKMEKFQKPYHEAIKKGIYFAESMPCFEVWFFLHFAIPKGYYQDQNDLIMDLQKYISGYNKKQEWLIKKGIYTFLKPHQKQAIQNTSSLSLVNYSNPTTTTSVGKLITVLLNFNKPD